MLAEDLVSRFVTCRLDADRPDPENRTFDPVTPMDKVRKDRGKYLAAVFTIIRAFAFRTDGWKPQPEDNMKRVAVFEQWSERFQQPLIWLKQPDPRGAMEQMAALDPKQGELGRKVGTLLKYSSPENKQVYNGRCREVG